VSAIKMSTDTTGSPASRLLQVFALRLGFVQTARYAEALKRRVQRLIASTGRNDPHPPRC
jgi:hypothetical protein